MAKAHQSSTPPFFNFLKEGLLLPARNRRLFLAVFALVVASNTSLHFLEKILAAQPITTLLNLDIKQPSLNGANDLSRTPDFHGVQNDTRNIMHWLISAAYHLVSVIAGSVVQIIALFAALTTYSGELHTFDELLRIAKTRLTGPLLTRALVYAMEMVLYIALLGAMAALMAEPIFTLLVSLPMKHHMGLLFVEILVLFIAPMFLMSCLSFLCSLSVVVAVAEPRCHGAAAVAHAWRLMKGEKGRVMLFIAVTAALGAVVYPVHTLADKMSDTMSGVLLEFLYRVLQAAAEVYSVCAMTVF